MIYAVYDNVPFTTTKEVRKKAVITKEQKERSDFIHSHSFSIVADPSTQKYTVRVEEKSI